MLMDYAIFHFKYAKEIVKPARKGIFFQMACVFIPITNVHYKMVVLFAMKVILCQMELVICRTMAPHAPVKTVKKLIAQQDT